MKLERQSILGNTVTGYRVVETPVVSAATEPEDLPEVDSNTPAEDIASVLLERLESESTKVGSRNGFEKQ